MLGIRPQDYKELDDLGKTTFRSDLGVHKGNVVTSEEKMLHLQYTTRQKPVNRKEAVTVWIASILLTFIQNHSQFIALMYAIN